MTTNNVIAEDVKLEADAMHLAIESAINQFTERTGIVVQSTCWSVSECQDAIGRLHNATYRGFSSTLIVR